MNPILEVLPVRPAVRTDIPVTLDVLLRIVPPMPENLPDRPALNLGLVLDRSGSMEGSGKMAHARQAAIFAVQQLLPEDRVSVTLFDDHIDLLVPSTHATDKQNIVELLGSVQPRGSTALHAGWTQGAGQVREFLNAGGLNRVLLLTDGLANVGETNADTIGSDVKRFAEQGVSTTTMGVGNDYNEDLLEAMAKSGDGNYYYIESAVQLADIFQTELRGLMATTGRRVTLALEPAPGVVVADVLNDLERDDRGRLVLPNLIVGMPVEVVVRLQVPAQPGTDHNRLCGFRLGWLDAQGAEQSKEAALLVPGVGEADWNALADNARVRERAALQMAGRLKRQATQCMDAGDAVKSMEFLSESRSCLMGLEPTPDVVLEEQEISDVEERVREGDLAASAKMGKYQHYNRSRSRKQP